jgi:hypothetical protein
MEIEFLRFLYLREPVVEIAPLRASKFIKSQENPSKNHKDLRVGNLIPTLIPPETPNLAESATATRLEPMSRLGPMDSFGF